MSENSERMSRAAVKDRLARDRRAKEEQEPDRRESRMRQEPDVQQQTQYPMHYRLSRGFSILRGGEV